MRKRERFVLGVALAVGALAGITFLARTSRAAVFEKWGRKFGVNPVTLRKIAQHESGMNPLATRMKGGDAERGGAWGLMQVTYATAQSLSDEMPGGLDIQANIAKLRLTGAHALLDPDVNVMYGAFYFSKLLRKFKGNELAAVGAYNRGAQGMADLIASGISPGALPYVQRVMA